MSKKKKVRQYTFPKSVLTSVLTAIMIYAATALVIALSVSRGGEILNYAHYLATAAAGASCFLAVAINVRRNREKRVYIALITAGCCVGLIAILPLLNSETISNDSGWHSMLAAVAGSLIALAFTKRIKCKRSRK